MNKASARFVELDALRGIAALWVVLYHYCANYDRLYGPNGGWLPPGAQGESLFGGAFAWFPSGVLGVYLFFIISGFVIAMTLDRCDSATDFLVSRFSRLLPAFWVALGLTASVGWMFPFAGQILPLRQVLINATMLNAFFSVQPVDTAYWSLTSELTFYALILVVFIRGGMRRIEQICWLWIAAELMALALLGFGITLPPRIELLLSFPYVQFFVAGIVFYRVRTDGYTGNRLCLLGACFVAAAATAQVDLRLAAPLDTLLFFAVFHVAVTGGAQRLAVRPLLWLGTISYPLYLTHQMIGFRAIFALLHAGVPASVAFPAVLAGALALAACITFAVEKPAMRCIRDAYGKLKATRLPRPAAEPLNAKLDAADYSV